MRTPNLLSLPLMAALSACSAQSEPQATGGTPKDAGLADAAALDAAALDAAQADAALVDAEALVDAAARGDHALLKTMLSSGADINVTNSLGKTALLAATEARRVATVSFLLTYAPDIDHFGQGHNLIDQTPFLHAGAIGDDAILDLLIPRKPDVTILNGYGGTALIPAAERGHVSTVAKLLKETSIDVNHINNLGWTALLEAIVLSDGGKDHQEIVSLLLQHGADKSIADKNGVTPLEHAKQRGFVEIVQLLEA